MVARTEAGRQNPHFFIFLELTTKPRYKDREGLPWENVPNPLRIRQRLGRTMLLERAQGLLDAGHSVRDAAQHLGAPRSTLQDWLANRRQLDSAADAFFGSPEGVEWLQRFVISAHFVITLPA